MLSEAQIHSRVEAAQGKIPCDLLFRNVTYLDVFSCAWRKGDVALVDGVIVALDPGLKAKREIDAKGKWLVPGFIDAHVHVESSMLVPTNFAHAVLPRGTTTAICDPHELANVQGVSGIEYFLDAAEQVPLDLRVMLSSCVPATHLETNGGGAIEAEALKKLRTRAKALGLAEMMNVPGVLFGDGGVLQKLSAFSDSFIDGHCPLVSGRALSAYAASGIKSCHESTRLEEAQEKLTKGISVWIREGSVAKDLDALAPLLTLATSTSVGFCTDDRNPLDIASEGHVDHLIRGAIRKGAAPEVAYRAASWSVARHYGLRTKGAVAPGYEGDLVLLSDPASVSLQQVFRAGVPTTELSFPAADRATAGKSVKAKVPEAGDLLGPKGRVHVIGVEPGKILTTRHVLNHDAKGVAHLTVLERYGRGSKPANAYALGFGESFDGAIASSVGHDSHNLIVVGSNTEDMRIALAALIECGGGYAVAKHGSVIARLPLPFGGLMSYDPETVLVKQITRMREASREVGCALAEPFLQLAFLSLPVIPSLKLTDRGLVDVDAFQLIDVRAA